jgi:transcriptional regulator with XRE-family HTH domain
MTLKEKITVFRKREGLTLMELAKLLEVDYQHLSKKINAENLPLDVIYGLAEKFPTLDMNWLLREGDQLQTSDISATYGRTPDIIMKEIRQRMDELEAVLSQK